MRPALNTALALGAAFLGLAVLTPAAVAQRTTAPCFVAGDALGVELHCAAVLALATPERDPMEVNEFPMALAVAPTQAPPSSVRLSPRTPPGTVHWTPVTVAPLEVVNPWTLLTAMTAWLTPDKPSFDRETIWMAIVN